MDKPVDHVFVLEAPPGETRKMALLIESPRLYQHEGEGMVYQAGTVKVIYDGEKIDEFKIEIKSVKIKRGEE